MTISSVSEWLGSQGTVGQSPAILCVNCNNSLAEVITAGFLTPTLIEPYNVTANDLVLVSYTGGVNFFNASITNGVITLVSNSGVDVPLASAHILVGNASGIATDVALSGDATLDNTGALTIANSAISTAKIAANAVTLAKLAAGITPSHIIKFSGRITWSGSGASLTTAVAGVLATDQVVATIRTAPTQAAYIASASTNTDQVILALSAANTSNDAVITYSVSRAVS